MLSGLPKISGEAKTISAEAAQKQSVNDRYFWYYRNVKYFVKDGEERLGFGHADVRNLRGYLREVKQSGNQIEYLALLQFIGNERSSRMDKFESSDYSVAGSQLKLNLDELASILRAQELKKMVAEEKIPIDPTNVADLEKNVHLLLDILACKNEIGGEAVIEKAMTLILSCLSEQERWGFSIIRTECRGFIERFLSEYVNVLAVDNKEQELKNKIDRTNLVGPWKTQLEALVEKLTVNTKRYRGDIGDDLIRMFDRFGLTAGKNFLKMFIKATVDFLPARDEDHQAFELLSKKYKINEKVLAALRRIEDPRQRFEEAKKICETVGADVVLDHIYELNLPSGQEEQLLEVMAEIDPESVLHHARYIDFENLKNRHEVYFALLVNSTELFVNYLDELNIDREELAELMLKAADSRPLDILVNFDLIMKKVPAIAQELIVKLKTGFESREHTDVEILNQLTDIKINNSSEAANLISSLRTRAIINSSDLLMSRLDFNATSNYAEKTKLAEDVKMFLAECGQKKGVRDVLEYTYSRHPEMHDRIIRGSFGETKGGLPPASPDAVLLILKELIDDDDFYGASEIILGREVSEMSLAGRKEIGEMVKMLIRDTEYSDMGVFKYYGAGWINHKELQNYFDEKIEQNVLDIVDFNEEDANLQHFLTDQQKERIIELLVENSPAVLAKNFYRLRVTNGKTEHEAVRKYMADGKQPFCLFQTPAEAIGFLSKKSYGRCWNEDGSKKIVAEMIAMNKFIQGLHNPEIEKMLSEKEYTTRNLSERNLFLMDAFMKRYRQVFEELVALDDRGFYWIDVFFAVKDEGDFPKLAKIIAEAVKMDKDYAKGVAAMEKDRGRDRDASRPTMKLMYWDNDKLGRTHSPKYKWRQSFRENHPEPPSSYHRGYLIGMALRLDTTYHGIIEKMEKLKKDLNQDIESNDPFAPIQFIHSEEAFFRLRFLEENKTSINRLIVFAKQKSISDIFSVLETICQLNKSEQSVFLNKTDWEEIIKGFDATEILNIYLKYCAQGLIRPSESESVKVFREYLGIFGALDSVCLFKKFMFLRAGHEPDGELKEIGVETTGNQGLRQFIEKYYDLRDRFILQGEFKQADWNLENRLVLELLSVYSDFDLGKWKGSDERFKELIEKFVLAKKEGRVAPLDRAFVTQKISVAELVDFDAENITLSAEATDRFKTLVDSSSRSYLARRSEEEQLQVFSRSCLNNIEEELRRLQRKLTVAEKETDEKTNFRQDGLSRQIDIIKRLGNAVETAKTSEELLRTLLDFETINDRKSDNNITTTIIREIVFARARVDHEDYFSEFMKTSSKDKPRKSDLEKMVEFVNNILKQHVWPTLDLPASHNKKLSKIFNVSELKKEISRLDEMLSGKKRELLCVPTREMLGEFSGYYANACWNALENIMEKNPAMTAVAFVSNPEDRKHRRLAGATLLIETTVDGKKAMIVRGLNPSQNVIEQLSAENFTEEFIEKYLLPICREKGIDLLLCPLHNHHALTNRPSIEEYLKKKYQNTQRVKLDETVNFNGYDITKSCVVLRDLNK